MSSKESITKFNEKINVYDKIFKSRPRATPQSIKLKEIESKIPSKRNMPLNQILNATEKKALNKKRASEIVTNGKNNNQPGTLLPVISESNQQRKEKKNETKREAELVKSKFPALIKSKPKSFLVLGGYPDLIKALIQRGWNQLKDPKRYILLLQHYTYIVNHLIIFLLLKHVMFIIMNYYLIKWLDTFGKMEN